MTRRSAEWLLARVLRDHAELDMVLGDLSEEQGRHGRLWYWREIASIAAHAAFRPRAVPTPQASRNGAMNGWINDVRYAWRSICHRPLVTLTIVTTLALGLGANAAIFNFIDRIVLHPYPVPDPDRVVMVAATGPGIDVRQHSVALADFYDWRQSSHTLESLSAFQWWDANLVDRGEPERLPGFKVTSGLFEALDVRPQRGRTFVRGDETFGRQHVAIIGDGLWTRRFNRDPSIVGRTLRLDGDPYEIVGVMPPHFSFPEGCEIWAPIVVDANTAPPRDEQAVTVIGRLKPGRLIADAQAEMSVIAARLAREYPETDATRGTHVYALGQGMLAEGMGPILVLWQISALIVLLIACANVANLLLARTADRRRDTAVRLALGASGWRIVRGMFVESVLLALIAIPPAIGVAWFGLHAIRVSLPADLLRFVPGFESLGPDPRLLGFTTALALLASGVFSCLPALQGTRGAVAETLKEGGRTTTGRQFVRRLIVVGEVAITLPLLVAAGLGILGARTYLRGPQGYDPDGVLKMSLVLPPRTYPDATAQRRFASKAIDALHAVPGVDDVAIVNDIPTTSANQFAAVEIDGRPAADPNHLPQVEYRTATAEYFSALRIPIARGRAFTSADREDTDPVAIVSKAMAQRFWPDQDPIGRRVRVGGSAYPWRTVVGVSGNIIHDWFNSRNAPMVYLPFMQAPAGEFAIAVRTSGDVDTLAQPARRALLALDPTQPLFDLMSMRQGLGDRTVGLRYVASVMGVFGGIALILATVGLYALLTYFVAQRRHEFGVRIALGASRADVVRLTVGQALRVTCWGCVIGLAVALALSRVMESATFGIAAVDLRLLAGFSASLLVTALLAGYLPARRAAETDPIVALRAE